MIPAAVILLTTISISKACVPTSVITTTSTTTTTTKPCCNLLSQTTLPRSSPSTSSQEQCSILRRISSTCPEDGLVICEAAQETNPANIYLEFFNGESVVRTATVSGSPATMLTAKVICINGVWRVPDATGDFHGYNSMPITSVSCSQSGSQGADRGYVLGSAV